METTKMTHPNRTMIIRDTSVDCACNKQKEYSCNECICYCHLPIWYRNVVWKTQEIPYIGKTIVIIPLIVFGWTLLFYKKYTLVRG
jgi:hypothetical protein